MNNTQTYTIRFAVTVVATLILLGTGVNAGEGQAPAMCRLTLEGQSITRLILRRKENGQREEFRRPEQSIELPIGQYRVQEIHLEGGYTCNTLRDPKQYLIRVTLDEPATLKLGGPLKPTVNVERQGRQLVMSYSLFGVGGELYTNGNTANPPRFTVYRGDKIIASDTFEYG